MTNEVFLKGVDRWMWDEFGERWELTLHKASLQDAMVAT